MKKTLLIFLSISLILCSTFLSACRGKVKDPNKVTNKLKDLESYSSDVHINVNNDKQKLTYVGKQYYLRGAGSRLELEKQRVFLFKDDNIYVTDLSNGLKYSTLENAQDIFKLSFIGEYVNLLYTNEVIKYSYKTEDNNKYLLIELIIPGNNRNMSKGILYVKESNNLPEKIIICDAKGKENVEITYENFAPNSKLETELFDISNFVKD